MTEKARKSAVLHGAQNMIDNELGNRCSILLSYRDNGGFPRVLRVSGQCRTRNTRGTKRFASSQESAHPVLGTSRKHMAPPGGNRTRPTTMPLEGMMGQDVVPDPLDWGHAGFTAEQRQRAIDRYGLPVVEALGPMPWGSLGRVALELFERREGIVYFVGGDTGPIKIGFTTRPLCRLASMQMGSPLILRIYACALGGVSVEREYHKRFAAHRLHGEWFERCPEIEAEITRLTTNTSEVSHG